MKYPWRVPSSLVIGALSSRTADLPSSKHLPLLNQDSSFLSRVPSPPDYWLYRGIPKRCTPVMQVKVLFINKHALFRVWSLLTLSIQLLQVFLWSRWFNKWSAFITGNLQLALLKDLLFNMRCFQCLYTGQKRVSTAVTSAYGSES